MQSVALEKVAYYYKDTRYIRWMTVIPISSRDTQWIMDQLTTVL